MTHWTMRPQQRDVRMSHRSCNIPMAAAAFLTIVMICGVAPQTVSGEGRIFYTGDRISTTDRKYQNAAESLSWLNLVGRGGGGQTNDEDTPSKEAPHQSAEGDGYNGQSAQVGTLRTSQVSNEENDTNGKDGKSSISSDRKSVV